MVVMGAGTAGQGQYKVGAGVDPDVRIETHTDEFVRSHGEPGVRA